MDSFSVFIYGLVQGLTEFFPVSSSGHLALLPHLLKIQAPGAVFDLWMHLGTALAVLVILRKKIISLFKKDERKYLFALILSTVVSVIFIFAMRSTAKSLRHPYIVAANLAFFGLLLWHSDKNPLHGKFPKKNPWKFAIAMGLFQSIAIFPGVSRSGITLTVARYMGLSWRDSAEYSFLLSLPVILGGVLLEYSHWGMGDWKLTLLGVCVSFISGAMAIIFFLGPMKKGAGIFCLYRIFLAVTIFIFL